MESLYFLFKWTLFLHSAYAAPPPTTADAPVIVEDNTAEPPIARDYAVAQKLPAVTAPAA